MTDLRTDTDLVALQSRVDELEAAGGLLLESLTALQIQLEDEAAGWIRLDQATNSASITQVKDLAHRAYEQYHTNPLIRRAVDITTNYVWGRGVSMLSPQLEVDATIRDFLDEPSNRAELGHVGLTEKEKTARIEGQVFFALPTDPTTGEVRVRTIPITEILDIVSNPEDYRDVWYFERALPNSPSGETVYHPALGFEPAAKPGKINDKRVLWAIPVYHAAMPRVCREPWALPDVASALVWGATYTRFLRNIATINAALSQVAMTATGKNPAATAALASAFNTGHRKPAIPTASTAILPDGSVLQPFKTAGVTTSADEARRFMLMVCATTGVPEHILQGDPATGNLATSTTMERPYELVILDRQRWWEDVLQTILTYVVTKRALAEGCTAIQGEMVDDEGFGRKNLIVHATRVKMIKPPEPEEEPKPPEPAAPETPEEEPVVTLAPEPEPPKPKPVPEPQEVAEDEPPEIVVEFPSVLEHDMAVEVKSVLSAATLDGKKPAGIMDWPTLQRLMLKAMNVADVDEMIADMDPEDIADQRTPAPAPMLPPAGGGFGKKPPAGGGEESEDDHWGGLIAALRSVGRRARGGA